MTFYESPYNIAWRVSNIIQIPIGLTFVILSFFYPERYSRPLISTLSIFTDPLVALDGS